MQFCPLCKFMTYTKLKKETNSDGKEEISGLTSYCKNCGWEGTQENIDNSIYKRNYEEDFIANKIVTNKYTIFDVTLPRVEYDCTNQNCVTNKTLDKDVTLMVSNIPADISEEDVINIFKSSLETGDIISIDRIKLTSVILVCKNSTVCNSIMEKYKDFKYSSDTVLKTHKYETPKKEVLYIKYDSINMRYLYICVNCGTSWKKN